MARCCMSCTYPQRVNWPCSRTSRCARNASPRKSASTICCSTTATTPASAICSSATRRSRAAEDRDALRRALAGNRLDVIGTDHAPHAWAEKQQAYPQAPAGLPLVQHALPALLELVREGWLSLATLVAKTSHRVAELFAIADRGFLPRRLLGRPGAGQRTGAPGAGQRHAAAVALQLDAVPPPGIPPSDRYHHRLRAARLARGTPVRRLPGTAPCGFPAEVLSTACCGYPLAHGPSAGLSPPRQGRHRSPPRDRPSPASARRSRPPPRSSPCG